MTTELETNIVAVESEGIHRNSYRGVVSENDNRLETNIVAVERVKGIHRNSYRGVVSENTTELETNIVAVESEGIHRNSYREMISENDIVETNIVAGEEGIHRNSYRGVVSENDNRVRDKHCSCRKVKEHRNSYRGESVRMTTELETNIVAVEVKGIHRNSYRGVVSENDNRVRDKHCGCRSEGIHKAPTEVNDSYFIYIPTQGVVRVVSENDNRELETNIVAVERVKEYTETPTEVNRVVSENDNRVRQQSCRESEGIHRNSYRGNIVAVELETNMKEYTETLQRVKEYTETPTEVNSSYFIYIPTQGVVSENDNRVRDKNIVAVERVKEYTESVTIIELETY
ncbi:unnamed protein product [Mytilus edulis]|uniref:Uncharacterized protein n=1 Tax=Mytilus edulis TaxID=6550 RepID=A0A8S3TM35_MYTED|nr:unnamed protein product [Mytilus edulis]